MSDLLSHIHSPEDIKHFDVPKLAQISREIRQFIISSVSNTGGHLAPSLGVIELTVVLHHIFNTPKDKIIWDVGHQCYAHKILTGRRELFQTIRQHGGISGFPTMSESEYDAFGVGHASTAISAALGMACARDLNGEDFRVIGVVGDGALTGGLAYEGLNNAGASGRDIIIVLNDNSMSISPSVGAISNYLTTIISNPIYNKIKNDVWELTWKIDSLGPRIRWAARRIQRSLKGLIIPGEIFEKLGFRYLGPIDGHNISSLIRIFREVKKFKGPILVHVQTKKGKGYKPAEENAPIFHGLGRFDAKTGELLSSSEVPTYTTIFGDTLVDIAEKNPKIVAITAAMSIGTGLCRFAEKFPDRFFDVGIAEEHAVTFAAGLAVRGLHPVVAVYSSFLQRSFDQIIHDVALQKLPVIFAVDRAGLVGDDGPTHHGVFDLSYLRSIPNLVVMVPKDEEELRHMLWKASLYADGPIAIRYPRGQGLGVPITDVYKDVPIGCAEVIQKGRDLAILALGPLVAQSVCAAQRLKETCGIEAEVVNMRFVKPVDRKILDYIISRFKLILTVEEGVLKGGLGSEVAEFIADRKALYVELIRLGLPDQFMSHGDRDILLSQVGLDMDGIVKAVRTSNSYSDLIRRKKFKGLFTSHRS
jgi:1-deoxy-D-xylulose-5-phosphate synthase